MSMRGIFALSVLASLPLVSSCSVDEARGSVSSSFAHEIYGSVSPKKTYSIVSTFSRGVVGKGEEFFIKDNKSSSKLGTIHEEKIDLGLVPTAVTAKWSEDETKQLVVVEYSRTAEVYCVERKDDGKFFVAKCVGIPSTAMIPDVNREDFGVKDADGFRVHTTDCIAGDWVDSTIPVYERLSLESLDLGDGNVKDKDFGLSFVIEYSNKGFTVSKLVKWGEVSENREKEILGKLKIR